MNIHIYENNTVRVIKDTRTPEQKTEATRKVGKQLREFYKTPNGQKSKESMRKWKETLDRLDAQDKKRDEDFARSRAEYKVECAKRDRWVWAYIVFSPFILTAWAIQSIYEEITTNGVVSTTKSFFNTLPYIIFPPLLIFKLIEEVF